MIRIPSLSKNEDYIKTTAVFIQFFLLMVQLLIYKYLGMEEDTTIHGIIILLCAIPVFCSVLVWLKKNLSIVVCFYLSILLIVVLQMLLFPENIPYLKNISFYFLMICIPCCINMATIEDESKMMIVIGKISIGIIIAGALFLVVYYTSSAGYGNTEYYMAFSYFILWPALVFQYKYFTDNNAKCLIISIGCFVAAALVGSRGALVAWGVYFIIAMLLSKKRKASNLILVTIIIAICLFYRQLLSALGSFLSSNGLNSRTIILLLNREFFSHDSGRNELLQKSMEAIHNHPFIGNGIAANYRIYDGFPHNLVVELLLDFGWIMGIIIVIILIYMVITAYMNSSDKLLFTLFVCAGFVPIMISGTYLKEVSFWIFLGYCLKHQRIKIHIKTKGDFTT